MWWTDLRLSWNPADYGGITEVSFNSAELAGLDQPVEIFAIDTDGQWGRYWQEAGLEPQPQLPSSHDAEEPEEGVEVDCESLDEPIHGDVVVVREDGRSTD